MYNMEKHNNFFFCVEINFWIIEDIFKKTRRGEKTPVIDAWTALMMFTV